jgi:hypothetical protein
MAFATTVTSQAGAIMLTAQMAKMTMSKWSHVRPFIQLNEVVRIPTQISQITAAIAQSLLEKASFLPFMISALLLLVVSRHQPQGPFLLGVELRPTQS